MSFEVDLESIKDLKYISCPYCGEISTNSAYEGNEKERSYID